MTVPTTAAKDISHLLNHTISKCNFQPSQVYTDICPNNDEFWKETFGCDVKTKLGLFHLMHRIVDTIDKHSELYWEAMVELKNCFYTYHAEDDANLIEALKNGHFGGKKYMDEEFNALKHSKQWNQRYSAYL